MFSFKFHISRLQEKLETFALKAKPDSTLITADLIDSHHPRDTQLWMTDTHEWITDLNPKLVHT